MKSITEDTLPLLKRKLGDLEAVSTLDPFQLQRSGDECGPEDPDDKRIRELERKLRTEGPEEVRLLQELVGLLESKGRLVEACQQLLAALRLAPQDPYNHVLFGSLLLRAWTPDAALDAFRRAACLDPDNVAAYIGAADALVRMGRISKAIAVLKKASSVDPEDPQVLVRIAALFLMTGDRPGAFSLLARAFKSCPDLAQRHPELMEILGVPPYSQARADFGLST